MKAMVLTQTGVLKAASNPLRLMEWPEPLPGRGEVLLKVAACGVCHTELDEIEGLISPLTLPLIPGHQVVGRVAALGEGAHRFARGDRVGVGWIYSACGQCRFCRAGLENLCDAFRATGKDAHGGYAEYMTVPEAYAYALPRGLDDVRVAPLLCAGAIGYRSLRLTGLRDGEPLGLTGFGGSAHLVLQMVQARFPASQVYVFARSAKERAFALDIGAHWAGDTQDRAPKPLRAIIDTTAAWKPVVEALGNLDKGGRLVINAIRKETADQAYLQRLSYDRHLWEEREVKSVANITAADIREFLDLAARAAICPRVEEFALGEANRALLELKQGHVRGAKVLVNIKM